MVFLICVWLCFFNQKTAYEMRISDWSSDVCSSDLVPSYVPEGELGSIEDLQKDAVKEKLDNKIQGIDPGAGLMRLSKEAVEEYDLDELGRASRRERVCQYV